MAYHAAEHDWFIDMRVEEDAEFVCRVFQMILDSIDDFVERPLEIPSSSN